MRYPISPLRVTQRDVAKLAGVSQAAVSLVLGSGNTASLSEETITRINEAARELGYVPNHLAQALKTRRTMTIGCVVPDITNPFYPSLFRGVQRVANTHGYDVIAVNTDGTPENEQRFLNWALQGRVDGVVGVFFTLRTRELAVLIRGEIPVVRIEATRKPGGELPVDDIYVDSRAAAAEVIDLLLSRGHERIAMIAGAGGPQAVRSDGYREAMLRAGYDPVIIATRHFSEEAGARAATEILDAQRGVSAIFAANDLLAIGVLQTLRTRGISVPRQMAVVGFDNISAAPLVTPALTTVTQFQDRMGEVAAEILLRRIDGALTGAATVTEMPFELIEREST